MFFFFQAEDGIRDRDVTGVQTCALPIYLWPYYALMATAGAVLGGYITYSLGRKGGKEATERKLHKEKAQKVFSRFRHWRSEERRVGKECRVRGLTEH